MSNKVFSSSAPARDSIVAEYAIRRDVALLAWFNPHLCIIKASLPDPLPADRERALMMSPKLLPANLLRCPAHSLAAAP